MHIHSMFVCWIFLVKGLPSLTVIYMYTCNVKLLLINNSFHKVTEWTKLTVIDHTAIDKTLGMDCVQYLLYS